MTPTRVGLCVLVTVLVLTPFLGFAAGEVAHHIWEKHPRHATGHHADASPFVWKTTPGTLASRPAPLVVARVERLVVESPVMLTPLIAQPPFVPPRV